MKGTPEHIYIYIFIYTTMDFDGLVTEHSFTYPEQNYSHEASVLIEDDFFVGDVVEIFSSPKRTSPSRSINRASEHPDLDPEMLRIVEEVIMAAEVAVTTNMDKTKRFHGRVIQGRTMVKLKDILHIYNRYKVELCIDTIVDSNLYSFLMDLDLIPEQNWWSKLDTVLNSAGSVTREMLKKEEVDTEENNEFAESYHQITMMQNVFESWKTTVALGKRKVAAQPLLVFSALRWIRSSSLPIQILFDSRRKILKKHGLPPRISDRLDIPTDGGLKTASKAMGGMHAWLMRKLFLAWYENTQKILVLRLKWIRRKRNLIFNVWKEFTITEQYHRRTLDAWGDRWKRPFKRFMLLKLRYRVKEYKRQLVLHAELANERRIMMTAFSIWYDQWELKRQLTRFIARWKNMGVLKTFDQWVAYTEDQKEYKMKINKSMRRLKNKTLTNAFDGWYSVTYAEQEEKRKFKKVTSWFLKGSMTKAFNTWVANVHKIVRERRVVERFIYRLKTRNARKIFNTWYDTIHKWKYNRTTVIKHRRYRNEISLERHFYIWFKEIRDERIIRRHIRMKNWNKAIVIFNEWKTETKELKALYRKLAKERRYATKFRIIRHWRVRAIKWKTRKNLLKLGAKHKRQQDIHRTLKLWDKYAKNKLVMKKRNVEAQKFLKRLHRRRVFKGFVNNLTVSRRLRTFFMRGLIVFKFWSLPDMFYAWRKYVRNKKIAVSMYMTNYKISKAITLWRNRLETTKEHRIYYKKGKKILLKNVKRKYMQNWKLYVLEQLAGKDERLKREKSYKRYCKKTTVRWLHEYTINVRLWRLKIKKAKAFQRKSMITLFFREWSDIIILHNKTSSLRNKVQKTYMKQYLNTWKIYIVNVKEENVRQQKAIILHEKLSVKNALRFWNKYTSECVHLYNANIKAMELNRLRILRFGFYNGFRSVLFKKRMMIQAEEIYDAMRKKETFKHWVNYYKRCKRNKKILKFFDRRTMSKHFSAWKKYYNKAMNDKTKLNKAINSMKGVKQHLAIMQWRKFTHRAIDEKLMQKHYNACLRFFKLNRRFRYLNKCLSYWHGIVLRRKYVDACSIVVAQRRRRKTLAEIFNSWRNMDKDITFGIMDPSRDSNSSSASGVDDYDDDIEIEEKEMESNATTKSNVVFEEPLKEV